MIRITHPQSLITHPESLIPHPESLIPHPESRFRYEVFGFTVEVDVEWQGLPDSRRDPFITVRTAPDACIVENRDGVSVSVAPWRTVATGDGYRITLDRAALFVVSSRGARIDCQFDPAVAADVRRHLFLDHILPLALNARGFTVLHASAVADGAGACAFVAESGGGKSTLAAAFARAGWTLLADDAVLIEPGNGGVVVRFSYDGLRLWPDAIAGTGQPTDGPVHGNGKRRVGAGGAGSRSGARLDGIYVLAPPEPSGAAIRIEPVTPRDAAIELIRSAFRLDITDSAMLESEFAFLSDVAARVPMRRLIYPRDFASLPRVREAVSEDLHALRAKKQEGPGHDPGPSCFLSP